MAQRLMDFDGVDRFDTSSMTAFALASAPSSIAFQQRLRERLARSHAVLAGRQLRPHRMRHRRRRRVAARPRRGPRHAGPADRRRGPGDPGSVGGEAARRHRRRDLRAQPVCHARLLERRRRHACGDHRRPLAAHRRLRDQIDDGRVRLTGRRSDLILRGGENIYPVEIEQALDSIRPCASPLSSASPTTTWNRLSRRSSSSTTSAVTEAELKEFLADRLAYFKVPGWRFTTTPLRTRNR